ncbi:aminotransferase class IV family protein [Clostridium sp. D2Q-14]|uniref:aminotransferase class IV n=1 Tax=Anaeromonas gelatinilytica TaxID=2683194 RepID=UPI00193C33C5|nr:aminotransferase class IV [Anaeromonas gelatinilytica]MBS4534590.1 aminotransferase class IV family protein [Anaeromonas gelatinilytica]
MKIESNGKFIIYNGNVYENNEDVYLKDGQKVYEVIRVIDGVVLFLDEHIERLKKSCNLIGKEIGIEERTIIDNIDKLIMENKMYNMNIKIILNYHDGGFESVFYFIDSFYPDKGYYEEGVKAITINAIRDNPQSKKINDNFKRNVKIKIKKEDAFEALLVNDEGHITEGSRSNIFFIKGDIVFTAPNEDVLMGITREKILEVCDDINVEVQERLLRKEELVSLEGVFMSGTSVGVLPIGIIDGKSYDSSNNEVVMKIKDGYDSKVEIYINSRK